MIGSIIQFARNGLHSARKRVGNARCSLPEVERWLEIVDEEGVCVVDDFCTADECEELRDALGALYAQFPDAIHRRSEGADRRVFGSEHASRLISEFNEDPRLAAAARSRIGRDATAAFTLAGHIEFSPANTGSGEGWHRDSFFNQFKSILYLTDVDAGNGPFEYIAGSHAMGAKLQDASRYGLSLTDSRAPTDLIDSIIEAEPSRHRVLTAPAGTLVLADTTGLHRGRPLLRGSRMALTNYYYPAKAQTPALFDHFAPVLGTHVPLPAA